MLDLASGGRFSLIGGIGYRPSEYAAHGKDWKRAAASSWTSASTPC